jgi:hypothetical protein
MPDLVGGPDVAGILVRPDVVLKDAVLLTDVTVLVPQVTDLVLELIVVPALITDVVPALITDVVATLITVAVTPATLIMIPALITDMVATLITVVII